jgi:hypothetical protein
MPSGLALVTWMRRQLRREPELGEVSVEVLVGRAFREHGYPPHRQADWDEWMSAVALAKRLEAPETIRRIASFRQRMNDRKQNAPSATLPEDPER